MGIYVDRSRDREGIPPYYMYPPPFGDVLVVSKKPKGKKKIRMNKNKSLKKM